MDIKTNSEAKPPIQEDYPENLTQKCVWTGSFATLAIIFLAAYFSIAITGI